MYNRIDAVIPYTATGSQVLTSNVAGTKAGNVEWATAASGTPAGSSYQLQYNNAGAFGADSRAVFDPTNKVIIAQFGFDSNCINAQTGTTYSLAASDNGKLVTLSNASAITLTVPSGLGAGYNCMIAQIGAGQVTVATSGTTLTSYGTLTKLAGQYACATLIANVANTFLLSGTLA